MIWLISLVVLTLMSTQDRLDNNKHIKMYLGIKQ